MNAAPIADGAKQGGNMRIPKTPRGPERSGDADPSQAYAHGSTGRRSKRTRAIPIAFDEHRFVHESLVELCDLLSEMLASTSEGNPTYDQHERLDEVNRRVWELRWELNMGGGAPISLADVDEAHTSHLEGGSEAAE